MSDDGRALYEELLKGLASPGPEGRTSELALNVRTLATQEESLADSEMLDGVYVDEDDQAQDLYVGQLAASTGARELPAEYRSGPWHVRLGMDETGETWAELVAGPGALQLPDLQCTVHLGEQVAVLLDEGPAVLEGIDPSGRAWTLS
jgi:hypothetical protein